MSATHYLFTSESVSEGHPDKVADRISDAILDAIIAEDKQGRVACETMVTTGMAIIAGEITTSCWVDMPQIVRDTIKEIGYNDSTMGFDWETCAVMASIRTPLWTGSPNSGASSVVCLASLVFQTSLPTLQIIGSWSFSSCCDMAAIRIRSITE